MRSNIRKQVLYGSELLLLLLILPGALANSAYLSEALDSQGRVHEFISYDLIKYDGHTLYGVTGAACENCILNATSTRPDAMREEYNTYLYERTLNLEYPTEYRLTLPPGAILDIIGGPNAVPTPYYLETDGVRTTLAWNLSTMPQRVYVRFVDEEGAETTMEELGKELNEGAVWLLISISLLVGIALGYIYGHYRKIPHQEEDLPYVPASLLSPDEKKLIKALSKETNQKKLGHELNWSKSKVSAILTNLEYKRIITREKHGRNYTITLVKEVVES
ncbi:MAG: helix-turn-helix transcriptional regulator [Candidatus Nanoarchaeia archaeon]